MAIVLVRFKFKPKNLYEKFVFSWLGVFVSITLFRFVADVDFWMDWTSWMGEIEIGIVLLVSKFFSQSFAFKTASKTKRTFVLFLLTYLIVGWWLVWTNRGFWMPRKSVEGTVEYILAKDLERIVGPGETVFLSGSTAFWLNSLVDVAQVRGGRDEVSQNENWRKVVWEVRGGVGKNRSVESLKLLGVDFLVVHGDNSSEYYHDFENPQGFEGLDSLEKVYDDAQDRIYKIK